MKKSAIIAIIVIAILLVVGYYVFNYLIIPINSNSESDLDSIPTSEFTNLDSNTDVLNEIDASIEELG